MADWFLCDANVWIALTAEHHQHGPAVTNWFESVREPGSLLFCRSTQQSFLRLLTTPAVWSRYGNPALSNQQAWETYESLLRDERVSFIAEEPPGLGRHWRTFSNRATASPKLWMDAYLAAFALGAGLTLVTTDRAFSQFEGTEVLVLGG